MSRKSQYLFLLSVVASIAALWLLVDGYNPPEEDATVETLENSNANPVPRRTYVPATPTPTPTPQSGVFAPPEDDWFGYEIFSDYEDIDSLNAQRLAAIEGWIEASDFDVDQGVGKGYTDHTQVQYGYCDPLPNMHASETITNASTTLSSLAGAGTLKVQGVIYDSLDHYTFMVTGWAGDGTLDHWPAYNSGFDVMQPHEGHYYKDPFRFFGRQYGLYFTDTMSLSYMVPENGGGNEHILTNVNMCRGYYGGLVDYSDRILVSGPMPGGRGIYYVKRD